MVSKEIDFHRYNLWFKCLEESKRIADDQKRKNKNIITELMYKIKNSTSSNVVKQKNIHNKNNSV